MQKISFANFNIEYNDKDVNYIDSLIQELKSKYKSIMDFFNLTSINHPISIKLWDDLDEYRNYFNNKMKKDNKKVSDWEVGRATNNSKECRIDLLSFSERIKCQGHQNDNIEDLIKVLIHEFVHICYFSSNNHKDSAVWFAEGLATYLAEQNNYPLFSSSLEDIIAGKATYNNYYCMVKYLIDNYDKEYILALVQSKELQEKITTDIYYKALESTTKKRGK